MDKPTVAIVIENGVFDVVYATEGVRVLIVDESAPNDRVYEAAPNSSAKEITELVGDDPVGSRNDDRHKAIAARVIAAIDGKPHLSTIE